MTTPENVETLENITDNAAPVLCAADIVDAFEKYAADFCADLSAKSPADLTQNQFTALCMHIGKNYIKPHERYFTRAAATIPVKNSYGLLKNNNAFDIDKLNIIYDCYLYIANKYDKIPTVNAFCFLCDMSYSTFLSWKDNRIVDDVSRKRNDFYKTVLYNHEHGLADSIVSGRRNPVGAIEQLNVVFGHSAGIIRQEENARAALPVDALPRLDSIGQNAQRFDALPAPEERAT